MTSRIRFPPRVKCSPTRLMSQKDAVAARAHAPRRRATKAGSPHSASDDIRYDARGAAPQPPKVMAPTAVNCAATSLNRGVPCGTQHACSDHTDHVNCSKRDGPNHELILVTVLRGPTMPDKISARLARVPSATPDEHIELPGGYSARLRPETRSFERQATPTMTGGPVFAYPGRDARPLRVEGEKRGDRTP